jgi:hypothetical protein
MWWIQQLLCLSKSHLHCLVEVIEGSLCKAFYKHARPKMLVVIRTDTTTDFSCEATWMKISKVSISKSVSLIEVHWSVEEPSLVKATCDHSKMPSKLSLSIDFHEHVIIGCLASPWIRLWVCPILSTTLEWVTTLIVLWDGSVSKLLGLIKLLLSSVVVHLCS